MHGVQLCRRMDIGSNNPTSWYPTVYNVQPAEPIVLWTSCGHSACMDIAETIGITHRDPNSSILMQSQPSFPNNQCEEISKGKMLKTYRLKLQHAQNIRRQNLLDKAQRHRHQQILHPPSPIIKPSQPTQTIHSRKERIIQPLILQHANTLAVRILGNDIHSQAPKHRIDLECLRGGHSSDTSGGQVDVFLDAGFELHY